MVPSPEGTPLLHRTVAKLAAVGASDLILGVGFQKEAVTTPLVPGLRVHRVDNDDWDRTNNIYTLALCFDYLKLSGLEFDNVLLIEGDICLGDAVLPRLLMEPGSATAVLPSSYTKRGSCVSVDDLGFVRILGDNRDWNDPSIFKLANIYKLTHDDLVSVGDELANAKPSEYYEAIIAKLVGRVRLKAVIDGECREIDNSYDWFNLLDSSHLDYASVRANWGGMWRRSLRDHFFISNPFYPTPFIKDRLKYSIEALISNYPSSRRRINQMLKACCNVEPGFPLYAVNGASEGIRILEQHFNSKATAFGLHFAPAFGEYLRFRIVESQNAEGLIVVSPNNPTGERIDPAGLRELLDSREYVILDLSLNAEKDTPYLDLMRRFPNLIIVKSLSKLMGVPGIRIGYVAVDPACIPGFEELLPIWNINSLAEAFLELHLDSLSDYERALDEWAAESRRLRLALSEFIPHSSLSPADSFITVASEIGIAAPLYEQYGVFAADVTAKFTDAYHHTRLGVRSKKENDYLLYALRTILKARNAPADTPPRKMAATGPIR
jgi:histidinol-phosphate/aromatic aminotransferase/cobyric acid decarboxylase-like protein/choline kinase